jgi:6-phosphogluconolactonase
MTNSPIFWCCLAFCCIAHFAPDGAAQDRANGEMLVYIGTYTGKGSEGIYVFRMNAEDGKLRERKLAAKTTHPSFLAIHPNKKFLYAVNETREFLGRKSTGGVTAFSIDQEGGALTRLGEQLSKGGDPCHITTDLAGKNVLVANHEDGNASVLPILKNGNIGPATGFTQHSPGSVSGPPKNPRAHSINLDPMNKFVVVADKGVDKIMVYAFDGEKGAISPHSTTGSSLARGSSPRHFAFHPSGQFAYVINEANMTMTAFSYDAKRGVLTNLQTISTLGGETPKGGSTAHVEVHPSGKFLYGSNRGHDTIVVYTIAQDRGNLTHVENEPIQGKTPRNFAVSPDGRFLLAAGQNSNSIAVFSVNEDTGTLDFTGHRVECPNPVCVKFLAL